MVRAHQASLKVRWKHLTFFIFCLKEISRKVFFCYTPLSPPKSASIPEALPEDLLKDLRHMINQTRQSIASTVNTGLTLLYWYVGSRIRTELLQDERAEYGQKIVATVSRQLTKDYGKGFLEKSLRRMIQFGETFPDEPIVAALMRQLSWTHFTVLIPIKDSIKTQVTT